MREIKYAQCWEDPDVLRRALSIRTHDDVISIASGGDNTLALLLDNPKSITAVDMNPAQLYLLELKIRAIQSLEYNDFLQFLGVRQCKRRVRLFKQFSGCLSDPCMRFWEANLSAIERGVIHEGKFERYLRAFRKFVLPLVHSRGTVKQLLSSTSIEMQDYIYRSVWDSRRWRLLFRLFFSRTCLGTFGRDRSHFQYVDQNGIAGDLLDRARRGLTEIPVDDNYFLHYILADICPDPNVSPPYLKQDNFEILRERIPRISLRCGELTQLLRVNPPEAFSCFNLSDILEYMSPLQVNDLLRELVRVSRPDSRLAFWSLFIDREVPSEFKDQVSGDGLLSRELRSVDRGFFYGGFHTWQLHAADSIVQRTAAGPAADGGRISDV